MAGEWIAEKARGLAHRFFPGEWRDLGGDVLQGRCPAADAHGSASGAGDARIYLGYGPNGEKPGCYCLHKSCKAALDDLNGKFRDAIFARDETGGHRPAPRPEQEGVERRAPRDKEDWLPEFNPAKLNGVTKAVRPVDWDWFRDRSATDPKKLGPGDFLETVFAPGERVLVFTDFKSQGDFLWEVGRGGYRLGEKDGVKAVRSALPTDGGKEGAWYLCQPVTGQWYANPRRDGRMSRRSEEAVTAWRHVVLECDEEKTYYRRAAGLRDAAAALKGGGGEADIMRCLVGAGGRKWAERAVDEGEFEARAEWHEQWARAIPGMWLKLLAMSPLAISAIYSSGGHSLHALVRVDQPSKPEFDTVLRTNIKKWAPVLGADPGALTPVRLTRLPGVTRGGRLQELVYVNPKADWRNPLPILERKPR